MPHLHTLLAALAAASGVVQGGADPAPHPPGWDDFPVFVWRSTHAGAPPPVELVAPFGGVILMRDEDSTWARERGYAYLVWNVAGRDALHLDADEAWNARVERWIETHDEALLVREPCLNDPATRAELLATLDATLARHGAHPGLGFVLGDEVSLTPNGDPFDLCRCAHCEARWKEYARPRGLPERAPLTDEVRLALLEDDFSLLGAWLARRRFDQERMIDVLAGLLARRPPRPWPTMPREPAWALLGCVGQTAFGGVALERIATELDLVECYPVTLARELVATVPGLWRHGLDHSTGPDGHPLGLTTLFVGEDGPDGLAWQVFDAWLRGASALVLWSDAELAATPPARARLVEAVSAVRALQWPTPAGQEPSGMVARTPVPRIAAVVHDADSTAASFLRDALLDGPTWPRRTASHQRRHGSQERRITTWLRLLEDCGLEPGAVPLASVCRGCANDFDLLVLPEVLVAGPDDVARLAAHVASGGTLVVDGSFGWVGRDGRPLDVESLRASVAGAHPERLVDAPAWIADHLAFRSDPARRERARRFVLDLLPEGSHPMRHPGFPLLDGEAARQPWRVHLLQRTADELDLALLPNHPTPAERARHLRDVPLAGIRAPAGFRLQWIHPNAGDTLRAGDAAVLRVTRERSHDPLPEAR